MMKEVNKDPWKINEARYDGSSERQGYSPSYLTSCVLQNAYTFKMLI